MQVLLLANISAIIDIVALVLLLIFALYGLIRGFTKTFFSIFGTIIGITISLLIAPSVVSFIQNKFSALDSMRGTFSGVAEQVLGKELSSAPLSFATQENLKGIAGLIANLVLSLKDNASVSADATIGEAVSTIFAYYVLLLICAVVLFIVFKIIFFLLGEIVKKAYKNKIVASADRLLGIVLGVINGIFNIELIILLISILPIPFFQQITVAISETTFTNFLQSINIYRLIFDSVINNSIINLII